MDADRVRSVDEQTERLGFRSELTGARQRSRCGSVRRGHGPTPQAGCHSRRPPPSKFVDAHLALVGNAHGVLVTYQRVRMLGDQRHGLGGRPGPTFRGVQVAAGQHPVHAELQERASAINSPPQRLGVRPGKVTGVGSLGKGGHRELEAELLLPGVDPLGRRLARSVGVESQHHPSGEPADESSVAGGEGCPAGGYRPLDTGQMATDDIGVALAYHQLVEAPRLGLRPMEAIEHVGLGVVLGGI